MAAKPSWAETSRTKPGWELGTRPHPMPLCRAASQRCQRSRRSAPPRATPSVGACVSRAEPCRACGTFLLRALSAPNAPRVAPGGRACSSEPGPIRGRVPGAQRCAVAAQSQRCRRSTPPRAVPGIGELGLAAAVKPSRERIPGAAQPAVPALINCRRAS